MIPVEVVMRFDTERFVADCRSALGGADSSRHVRELVARAVSEPAAVLEGLGAPARGAIQALHRSDDLTILNVVWAPLMTIMPHDHRMWAVIGIYTGREDNIFWRRLPDGTQGRVEAASARALCERDTALLGAETIHSVTNPIGRLSGALHVYGGDFFAAERSEWNPESLMEQRYDVERAVRLFEEANRRSLQ
jgi:predicted metal-dependent enzyme (double-stranded beta helix superfamily)